MSFSSLNCQIAVVGMACRYPDAENAERLFLNSLAQRRSFRMLPETRLSEAYFDEMGKDKDCSYVRQAAVLKNFTFDRERFRIPLSSYKATDMTHWLALTVAREAIEGIKFRKHKAGLDNNEVRVIVGNTQAGEFSRANIMRLRWPYVKGVVAKQLQNSSINMDGLELAEWLHELEAKYKKPFPIPNEDFLAGGLGNTIAGRICNHFDFKGGGYTIDGACSSSLLAITDACSALAVGDANMAIAGGVDLSLDPFELVGFSRTSALARNEMLVYDEGSEGFWPGEGCGFVVLMRYEDALKQCEEIHGVISGWAVSSDGKGGLTRPELEGQQLAMQRCYKRAGYGIETVGYFEGHGTGTKAGDSVELEALVSSRRMSGKPIQPAVISSIKANIGHTKAAAGMAGLLRALKCVQEGILPPTTACIKPHPIFADNRDNLMVSDRPQQWEPHIGTRRAGISAMGFGGINTHITIEEAQQASPRTSTKIDYSKQLSRLKSCQDAELFIFSATNRNDLIWTINYIWKIAHECSRAELTDLASELARRSTRGALSIWKAAVVAKTPRELAKKLKLLEDVATETEDGVHLNTADGIFLSGGNAQGKIGLVFSGQGSPVRPDGGVHERRFDEVSEVFHKAQLSDFKKRDDTDFAQPAITVASIAGLEMLKRLGVEAKLAIGHSLGELSALYWAGRYNEETLISIVKARGRIMAEDSNANGAMAAIAMDRRQTVEAIGSLEDIFIANINSPDQTVVSGSRQAIDRFVERLKKKGRAAKVLAVKQAFHTPFMEDASNGFRKILDRFQYTPSEKKIVSTVTGEYLLSDTNVAAHLCEQLAAPVEFMNAVKVADDDVDLFIEVGPGNLMANLINGFCNKPALTLDVGGKSLAPFLNATAASYVLGNAPEIASIFNDRFFHKFDWDWRPEFLMNPCESSPVSSGPKIEKIEEKPKTEEIGETNTNTYEHLRQAVAVHIGLPTWTIQGSSRMLSDLHLNSITVGDIVTSVATSIGLKSLVDPTEFADNSIEQIAEALDHLVNSGADTQPDQYVMLNGADSWVRYFEMVNRPAPLPEPGENAMSGTWEGFGALSENANLILSCLNKNAHNQGVIVWLDNDPGIDSFSILLKATQRCIERRSSGEPVKFVVVQKNWGVEGFAKSFYLENSSINTLVINLENENIHNVVEKALHEIDMEFLGFREVRIDATGKREEPIIKLVNAYTEDPKPVINENDLVLVTGGGKGISAECGYQLAKKTGCALLILGRSNPIKNSETAKNIQRLSDANIRISYLRVDIKNADEVTKAVKNGFAQWGMPITGIIHGAGVNRPCTVASLMVENIEETVSTKVEGFQNILTAINPSKLKLLVNFSSIISRIGLYGEADYALANEWLSQATSNFQIQYPDCRCRAIEWSVWSGTGMGQRLGRLDALIQQGISPISIDDGVREFLHIVETPDLPTRLIVTGRFGNLKTVEFERPPKEKFRFIDKILLHYPETELITESALSVKTDLYLDDHKLNGERILPAVMAMEAMTEAIAVLFGHKPKMGRVVFCDLAFRKAIVIPSDGDRKDEGISIRVAVLAETNGEISLAISCSTTGFQVNHIEAHCILKSDDCVKPNAFELELSSEELLQPFDPVKSLYESILFQSGRFKRIEGYHMIEARQCSGKLLNANEYRWFSEEFPQEFLLGDPGARDAALHAIQACIPHKTVIPIAVEQIEVGVLDPTKSYRVFAKEVEDRGDELVYNMAILDEDDQVIERWHRMTLRVVSERKNIRFNSPFLMSSFFERQVVSVFPDAEFKTSVSLNTNGTRQRNSKINNHYRPDGKPDQSGNKHYQSVAYSSNWKLAISSKLPIGCDLEQVKTQENGYWQRMLGVRGFKLVEIASEMLDEAIEVSATRVWAARESMKKAGLTIDAPLVIDLVSSPQWVVFKSGKSFVFSSLVETTEHDQLFCVAAAIIVNN